MTEIETNYSEWEKIFAKRKEFEKQNPKLKFSKRYQSYKDEKGEVRCSKCGRGSQIGTCSDCIGEKEFLQTA